MKTKKTDPPVQTTRRNFLSASAAAGSFLILPGGIIGSHAASPNEKLSVAFVGMGGQIQGHVKNTARLGHNVIAFCDVDPGQINSSLNRHKGITGSTRSYADYRILFEKEKSIDAVVIATPDHWHAPICKAAIAHGKHVYCEKPLTHTVAEARELRELSRASRVVTQTGNQGSASSNLRRSMELIEAGVFGTITDIHIWHPAHGWPSGVDRPKGADFIPTGMNWDFWLGPAPIRPYKSSIYHPAKWRGWYDFGGGSLADFCCHAFNLPARALNLDYPTKIGISGEGLGKESYAKSCTVKYLFPARGNRGPVRMNFYTGGDLPPKQLTDELIPTFGNIPRVGCVMVGDKGILSAGLWNSQCYVKLNGEPKFRGADKHDQAKAVPQTLPRVKGHIDEFYDACAGKTKTFSNFDLGGHITEIGLAGNVALQAQQDLDWDGPNMKARGNPGADRFIRRGQRSKWLWG